MSKRHVSQPARNRQKLIEGYPKDEQIDILLETQDMTLRHSMELNTAIDDVFRNLVVEPGEAKIASGKEDGLLQALYQLYIVRYGRDPEVDGVIMPQDVDEMIQQKLKKKTDD